MGTLEEMILPGVECLENQIYDLEEAGERRAAELLDFNVEGRLWALDNIIEEGYRSLMPDLKKETMKIIGEEGESQESINEKRAAFVAGVNGTLASCLKDLEQVVFEFFYESIVDANEWEQVTISKQYVKKEIKRWQPQMMFKTGSVWSAPIFI